MTNEQKHDEIIRRLNKSADRLFNQRHGEKQHSEPGVFFEDDKITIVSLASYYVAEFNFVQNDDGTWTREFVSRKFDC